MSSVFEKLNLKQQQEILVVNAPSPFEPELLALKGVAVHRDPKKLKAIHFALVFATKQTECEFNRDTGGMKCEALASIPCAKSLLTKIGRHSVFGAWSSSNRPELALRASLLQRPKKAVRENDAQPFNHRESAKGCMRSARFAWTLAGESCCGSGTRWLSLLRLSSYCLSWSSIVSGSYSKTSC
ncbi:MAG TPA: hypothetical protein VIT67_06305 [Povalibacter sp.]